MASLLEEGQEGFAQFVWVHESDYTGERLEDAQPVRGVDGVVSAGYPLPMLVRLAIRLMLPAIVVTVFVVATDAGRGAQAATEVQLDSYRADNTPATATGPVLANGQQYTITITGTFSYWPASQWVNHGVCVGSAEDMPMFPSPGTTNGKVGVDSGWHFAAPGDAGDCSGTTYPRIGHIEISLDGGVTNPEVGADDAGAAPNAGHVYHYAVVGQGQAVVVSINDAKTTDNYGILKISIELATPLLTWGDNDCLGGIAALDALPTLVHGFGLAATSESSCPQIGQSLNTASFGTRIWGDLDCSGYFDAPDVLLILRYVANLPPANLQDCPALGITVALAPI